MRFPPFAAAVCIALLTTALHAQQAPSPEVLQQRIKKMFDTADANGDSKLSKDEIPERRRASFGLADTDHDGFISREEYAGAMGQRPAVATGGAEAKLDLPYADTDNPRQRLDLYLPKVRSDQKPRPLVVFIHGGGWQNGDKSAGSPLVARFVESTGYAGVSLGYRLTNEAQWPAQIHDCKAAIRWLKAHAEEYHLDPGKIAAWGGSAGGHLASMLGTSADVKGLEGTLGKYPTQDTRIACVVNFFGPQNLLTLRDPKTIDRTKAKNYAEALLIGGLVSDHAAVAKDASPVTHISAGDAPFFTAHGTKDLIVPFSQAEELHAELTQAGVPSILQQVTHGGHGFPNAELDKRAKQFLDRHLRGNTVEIVTTPIEWPTGR